MLQKLATKPPQIELQQNSFVSNYNYKILHQHNSQGH